MLTGAAGHAEDILGVGRGSVRHVPVSCRRTVSSGSYPDRQYSVSIPLHPDPEHTVCFYIPGTGAGI